MMTVYSVRDTCFSDYGRIIEGYDVEPMLSVLRSRPCPEDVLYVPSDPELEALPVAGEIQQTLCGRMPAQIGYTNGHCTRMNALEYHKSSEFNVADQDIILLLARRQDLDPGFRMDTARVKAFLVPRGVLVEIYATTLHYAPCQTGIDGYRCIVVLPRGTNLPLPERESRGGEDRLLAAVNKWLIGHPEGGCAPETYLGLTGENLSVSM